MGIRNQKKKKKNRRCLWFAKDIKSRCLLFATKKSRKKPSSSTYTWSTIQKDLKHFNLTRVNCDDAVSILPWSKIRDIIDIIYSRKTPNPATYMNWDRYAMAFYLKMCSCFGVDYRHLEAACYDVEKSLLPSTKETEQEHNMESCGVSKKEMSNEELHEQALDTEIGPFPCITGPFECASYSSGPDRIPYQLYLLVKEAVDIMKRSQWRTNTNDLMDLTVVENKICFFSYYLHSHLPTGWTYHRADASSLIAGYDTTGYLVAGYTPILDRYLPYAFDWRIALSAHEMINVMRIIHSRKTPTFWDMCWSEISFYCSLCSCLGIACQRLESASEADVSLLNMG